MYASGMKPTTTLAEQSVARVKAWLASEMHRRREIAKAAYVDEKTIRLSLHPAWDPRASTLRKLELVMPQRNRRGT